MCDRSSSAGYTFYMPLPHHGSHFDYFELAYRTGSDLWSHIPYQNILLHMLPQLPEGSFALDVGSGRGLLSYKLIELGYKVLGVDFVPGIVEKANHELRERNLAGRGGFVVGDALDIPFVDASFDIAFDIGLIQHLFPEDFDAYVSELHRVVKPGGYVMSVELSIDTPRFLGHSPKTSSEKSFEKFGLTYTFWNIETLGELFVQKGFELVSHQTHLFEAKSDPGDSIALLFSLFKKK